MTARLVRQCMCEMDNIVDCGVYAIRTGFIHVAYQYYIHTYMYGRAFMDKQYYYIILVLNKITGILQTIL